MLAETDCKPNQLMKSGKANNSRSTPQHHVLTPRQEAKTQWSSWAERAQQTASQQLSTSLRQASSVTMRMRTRNIACPVNHHAEVPFRCLAISVVEELEEAKQILRRRHGKQSAKERHVQSGFQLRRYKSESAGT